jgi:uncharacterized protein YecT (DUF1311 family)
VGRPVRTVAGLAWLRRVADNMTNPSLIPAIPLLALLSSLGLPAHTSSASPGQNSTSSAQCEHAQTTAAMRECELSRYKQADAGMTAAYQALMGKLDQTGQAKLRNAQRAWLKFRDAEADFQADSARGGTLAPLIRTSVLADLTESRRQQLLKEAKEPGP